MRSLADIESDIASLDAKRRLLAVEREVAVRLRDREMLRLWDDEELSFNAIAERLGMHQQTVKQMLWNRGRTVAGRQAAKAMLAAERIVRFPQRTRQ